MIRQIGDLLGVDELKMLDLKQADANVTIRDGKFIVDKMAVASNNFIMDATGESDFNGALSLAARFHVNEKFARNLEVSLEAILSPRNGMAILTCHFVFPAHLPVLRPIFSIS